MFLDIVMGRKNQVGLVLTPAAIAVLDELAHQTELSRAAVVEAIAQAQIQVLTGHPHWTFVLEPTAEGVTVKQLDQSAAAETPASPEPKPDPPEASPPAAASAETANPATASSTPEATATVRRLEQDIITLQAQLTTAQTTIGRLEAALHQRQLPSPEPTPQSAPAPQPPAASNAAAATSDASAGVARLQEQLLQTRATCADLEQRLRAEQAETQHLQQALAQMQTLARIGEHHLNRWQGKTCSR